MFLCIYQGGRGQWSVITLVLFFACSKSLGTFNVFIGWIQTSSVQSFSTNQFKTQKLCLLLLRMYICLYRSLSYPLRSLLSLLVSHSFHQP